MWETAVIIAIGIVALAWVIYMVWIIRKYPAPNKIENDSVKSDKLISQP